MNWDAIGATAEMAAALTVIVTLLYLSRQIRLATRESRFSTIHDLSDSYTGWLQSVATNGELSDIWERGLLDYDALNQSEATRFLLIMGSLLRIMDDAYSQYASGRMEESDWEIYSNVLNLGAGASGLRVYIEIRDGLHSPKFLSMLKQKIKVAQPHTTSVYQAATID